jgi:hypothetical protein
MQQGMLCEGMLPEGAKSGGCRVNFTLAKYVCVFPPPPLWSGALSIVLRVTYIAPWRLSALLRISVWEADGVRLRGIPFGRKLCVPELWFKCALVWNVLFRWFLAVATSVGLPCAVLPLPTEIQLKIWSFNLKIAETLRTRIPDVKLDFRSLTLIDSAETGLAVAVVCFIRIAMCEFIPWLSDRLRGPPRLLPFGYRSSFLHLVARLRMRETIPPLPNTSS